MNSRRGFITLLGGAAAAWPVAAWAQQPATPVIGLLLPGSAPEWAHDIAGFHRGLRETGFIEGQNLTIEYRWAEGRFDRLPALVADLVQRRVAVMAVGPRADAAAKAGAGSIPVVFLSGSDPVRTGLVSSLSRPGGNLTGVAGLASDLSAKRFGLLRDLVPQATTIGFLVDTNGPSREFQLAEVQAAARGVGQQLRVLGVGSEHEFEAAFRTLAGERIGALLVGAGLLFYNNRDQLVVLAARERIPTIYELREYAASGGLMSYGASTGEQWREVGVYVGRILKGEKPADLPVMLPTKFELVINLGTAKALGLVVSRDMQLIADEVIE
jgi:putative ABC transport system substrate-binding protein